MWEVLLQGQLLNTGGATLTHVGVFQVKTRMLTK